MLKFLKKKSVIISIIIILAAIGTYFYFSGKSGIAPETVIVGRGNILQEVSVTGKTKSVQDVDLAFEQTGKVQRVNVSVGDKVTAGQILAELNTNELYAQLLEAQANVDTQKAELDELKKGEKAETIQYYETKVANAKIALEDAKRNLVDKINDAYTKSEDGVRNKIDQLFSNPMGASPTLIISVASGLKVDLESGRFAVESTLNSWKLAIDNLIISSNLNYAIASAKTNLNQIRTFLEKNALAVNSLTVGSDISQTTIDTYKSAVSTARTNVNTASTNLQSAEESLRTAESTVALAEKDLAVQKSGSTPEQISAQEALVRKAEASADIIRVKIGKNLLRSPINGVVAKQDAKVGEIIAANIIIASVISVNGFEIETNVPEADIAKVKVGDSAKVTLDAFGNDVVFEAGVIKIDPGEIMIEGVATYKVTLQFVKESGDIRSGMTANIDILTDKRENVIIVPQRAVIAKNNDKIIRILDKNGVINEVKVETGLRGSDGNVEIISGLKEGDNAVVFVKE